MRHIPNINLNGAGGAPGAVTIETTSTLIVAANTHRTWLYMTNLGTKDVWLSATEGAVLLQGIKLAKNGGSIFLSFLTVPTGPVFGIVNNATSVVAFQEGS